jgi:hypothetical protein
LRSNFKRGDNNNNVYNDHSSRLLDRKYIEDSKASNARVEFNIYDEDNNNQVNDTNDYDDYKKEKINISTNNDDNGFEVLYGSPLKKNLKLSTLTQKKERNSGTLSEGLQQEINILKQLKKKLNKYPGVIKNTNDEENSSKNKVISDLEKSVKLNEARIEKMSKNMEAIIKDTKREGAPNMNMNMSHAHSNSYHPNGLKDFTYEFDQLKQENVTLKADTLIFREDINHLAELNKNFENELSYQRKKM